MAPTLSLELVAEVTAAVEAHRDRAEVLAERGLAADVFEEAQRDWMTRIAEGPARGDLALAQRWVALLAAARTATTARAAATRKRRAAPGPAPEPPRVRASTRRAPRVVATTSRVASPPAQRVPTTSAPAPVAPPPVAPPPVAPPANVAVAPAARRAARTLVTDLATLAASARGAPLPFAGATASGATPPPPRPATPEEAPPSTQPLPGASTSRGKTMMGVDLAKLAPSLPFARGAAAVSPAARVSSKTMSADLSAILAGIRATPFAAAAARPAPAPPAPGAPSPAGAPPPAIGPEEATRRASSFTLAQYARLGAELRRRPEDAAALRARHGIDDATWAALHRVWQERFRENPTLRARWEAQVQQILGRLQAGGK